MQHQVPHAVAMSVQDSSTHGTQPLPAKEQLDLLFHLADSKANLGLPSASSPHTPLSLPEAYRICQQITRHHSKSFFFSTQFLPAEKRQAVHALYAFCRTSDDKVDIPDGDPACSLADWVRRVHMPEPPQDDPVLVAWHDTRTRYNVSSTLIDELLAGIAMDLTIKQYATFADLWLYCYRVASVVGLLSIDILGADPQAPPYAIKLGVALQMTNILRDVGEDAQRERIYLPEEDLERFELSPSDILNGVQDERFQALMRFEIARTHQLYDESWPGIRLLPADSRLGVGVAARVYRGILDKIVLNGYDVFTYRAHLTFWDKVKLLPHIWQSV